MILCIQCKHNLLINLQIIEQIKVSWYQTSSYKNLESVRYVSNLTHFLNEKGNIPKDMPREAREMAGFLAMVVDFTSKTKPSTLTPTGIRCFRKGFHGIINSTLKPDKQEVHWYCPECENEGVISHWQKTKWDNSSKRL